MKNARAASLGSCLALVGTVALVGWRLSAGAAEQASPPARVAAIRHIMAGVNQPHCAAIAAALKDGPKDDAAWADLALHAALLNESGHLLVENSRCPDATWANAAGALQRGAAELFAAAGQKDLEVSRTSFKGVTGACGTCHAAHRKPAAPPASERPATVSQLMISLNKPNCAALGQALKDPGPADDEAWQTVARHAAILNEAGHILTQNDRCPDKTWADACAALRASAGRVVQAAGQK
ncbi:MAG: cytochrome c, partial [Planctomycetes bacterium]|nr:cytochrome c [Planctomycetota bacterium]